MEFSISAGACDSNYEYDIAGAYSTRPVPSFVFADKKIQYNQHKNDPAGCTRYAVMTCITNNRDITWTDADFTYFRKTAPSYWWTSIGMELSRAGDMVVDYLNRKYPWQGRVKEQIRNYTETDKLYQVIKDRYNVQMWSNINPTYTTEIKDGVLDKPRGKSWQGHSRSFAPAWTFQGTVLVENFLWVLPYNVIDIRNLEELIAVKQLFNNSFIYYPTGKMPIAIPYKYITPAQADILEKKYPDLFTSDFSESVLAWEIAAKTWNMKYNYTRYEGIDWVMKMMIDLKQYRG